MSVYLDFNATTPVAPSVIEEIHQTLRDIWGNPSSCHALGKTAKNKINEARKNVASMINTDCNSIIFTSGGTEANNMTIMGVVNYYKEWLKSKAGKVNIGRMAIPHIITSNVEHDSVSLPLKHLKSIGEIDLTVIPISSHDSNSFADEISAAVRENTCLVTVMLANNEIGAILPITLIARNLREINSERKSSGCLPVYLHTDAAQAIGKIPVDVNDLGVDFLTVAGHKFYGPRIGCLYCRDLGKETHLKPLLFGGGQECGFRPGTENTAMIAGLGEAARLVQLNIEEYSKHMAEMRTYLEVKLQSVHGEDGVVFNDRSISFKTLPNTCSVSFVKSGLTGSSILEKCGNIMASVGAACHGKEILSENLLAFNILPEIVRSTIRLSVGRETTKSDIDRAVDELCLAVGKS